MNLGIVIRGTNERTLPVLIRQLKRQMKPGDEIKIINYPEPFENKLRRSFETAISMNKPFSLMIDGDILLRDKALNYIKKATERLKPGDLGFSLKVFDKFYKQNKHRGLHIYRTNHISRVIEFIPGYGQELRPESAMKEKMKVLGYYWHKTLSLRVIGLHDYFQDTFDIYYKYLIRAFRSPQDIHFLKNNIKHRSGSLEFRAAALGLENALQFSTIYNDKSHYQDNFEIFYRNDFLKKKKSKIPYHIDLLLLKELVLNYGIGWKTWSSMYSKV